MLILRNTSAKWQTWAQNPKHEIRNSKQIQNQNDQKQFVFKDPCKSGLSRHRFEHLNFGNSNLFRQYCLGRGDFRISSFAACFRARFVLLLHSAKQIRIMNVVAEDTLDVC